MSRMPRVLASLCLVPLAVPLLAGRCASPDPDAGDPTAGTPSELREVAVAHVRGDPEAGGASISVTAVGTGAGFRLHSWTLHPDTKQPIPSQHTDPILGLDVKLHLLDEQSGLLVVGFRRNGELWLTSWFVGADGTLTEADSAGYGNGGLGASDVDEYAIAGRPLESGGSGDSYQVATPAADSTGRYELVTWRVDEDDGAITGLGDVSASGQTDRTEISIAHLTGARELLQGVPTPLQEDRTEELFVVTYAEDDTLRSDFWRVSDFGSAAEVGGGQSGFDLHGQDAIQVAADEVALLRFTESGFVTASLEDDEPLLSVWDFRDVGEEFETALPSLVSDSDYDTDPDSVGIQPAGKPAPPANLAILTDLLWEEQAGVGEGAIFEKGYMTLPARGIGSIAKVMTLTLTLEAIQNEVVALTDLVTVSSFAATGDGHDTKIIPPLMEGGMATLRTLLNAMMKKSDNRAAYAIAEHVADAYLWPDLSSAELVDWFTDQSDIRAGQLGMEHTIYCNNPAGGVHSTPQDQVTLWRHASALPGFWDFAGVGVYDPMDWGDPFFPLDHTLLYGVADVVGLDGWKGGYQIKTLVGYDEQYELSCSAFDELSEIGNCQYCLIAQASRLGRSMLAEIQQAQDPVDRISAVKNLLYHGFEDTFAPDRRAQEEAGVVLDFAIDRITDSIALQASIREDHSLEVCSWQTLAGAGQLAPLACHQLEITGLQASAAPLSPARVEMVQLSDLESEADLLRARLRDVQNGLGILVLDAWRIAPRP